MLLLGASAAAVMAQSVPEPPARGYAFTASSPVAADIERWSTLRQSDSLPFSAYATFLRGHRGWPGEAAMRRAAEQRVALEPISPGEVLRFFSSFPPLTPAGHAYQAFALQSTGRSEEARAAARRAWTAGVLPLDVEQRLLAAFGGSFTPDDHDRRMEVLLGNGDSQSAARTLIWAPAAKRPLFEARLALQTRAPDAYDRVAALDPRAAPRRRPADRPGDLAAERQPERRGAGIARRARPVRPAGRQSRALSRHGADPGARRRQRPPMVDRLRHRRQARRPLPGGHRRLRPAL